MESFLINNVRGSIVLDTRREKQNKDDKKSEPVYYPVKHRITYQGKQIYIGAGFDLTQDEWDRMPNTKKVYLIDTRQVIKADFKRLEKLIEDICKDGDYSHEKLLTYLKKGKKLLIIDCFDDKIKELTENGQVGTAGIYGHAKKFIENNDPDTTFSQVTKQWLEKFEKAAVKEITYSTLSMYLRCLRTVFNDAIHDRKIKESDYPFARSKRDTSRYRIKDGSGTKVALTADQLTKIFTYTPDTKAMTLSRDLFILSFLLAGINFKDMLLLKWDNIKGDEIVFQREKTKNTNQKPPVIRIPYTPPAKQIIESFKSNSEYLLPYMIPGPSPADIRRITLNILWQTNKHLREIGKSLKIDGLSSMVARHSFATRAVNAGAPVALIGEMLGHQSLKTTANYLKAFDKEKRTEYYDIITKTLN